MMPKFFISLLFLFNTAHAAFMIDTMTGYTSSSDSKTTTSFNDMTNHIFLGASLDSKQHLFVGQNITLFTQQIKTSTTNKINTMELGPRLTYFFTEENVFYGTLAWNPYAKGTRTINGTSEEISGYGILAGFGAALKINRNLHIGVSLDYKMLTITKAISSANVATTASNNYTSINPMINLSLRFH